MFTARPKIIFAGATYTANSDSTIVIQGQTLIPGSPAITISNIPISPASGASIALIAGQTQSLFPLTFAGSTYTANAASGFTIQGQTLCPGGVITVANTPISLATVVFFVVITGSTQSLAPLAPALTTGSPLFMFNGSMYVYRSR